MWCSRFFARAKLEHCTNECNAKHDRFTCLKQYLSSCADSATSVLVNNQAVTFGAREAFCFFQNAAASAFFVFNYDVGQFLFRCYSTFDRVIVLMCRHEPGRVADVSDVFQGRISHLEAQNKRLHADKSQLEVDLEKSKRREEELRRQVTSKRFFRVQGRIAASRMVKMRKFRSMSGSRRRLPTCVTQYTSFVDTSSKREPQA